MSHILNSHHNGFYTNFYIDIHHYNSYQCMVAYIRYLGHNLDIYLYYKVADLNDIYLQNNIRSHMACHIDYHSLALACIENSLAGS